MYSPYYLRKCLENRRWVLVCWFLSIGNIILLLCLYASLNNNLDCWCIGRKLYVCCEPNCFEIFPHCYINIFTVLNSAKVSSGEYLKWSHQPAVHSESDKQLIYPHLYRLYHHPGPLTLQVIVIDLRLIHRSFCIRRKRSRCFLLRYFPYLLECPWRLVSFGRLFPCGWFLLYTPEFYRCLLRHPIARLSDNRQAEFLKISLIGLNWVENEFMNPGWKLLFQFIGVARCLSRTGDGINEGQEEGFNDQRHKNGRRTSWCQRQVSVYRLILILPF